MRAPSPFHNSLSRRGFLASAAGALGVAGLPQFGLAAPEKDRELEKKVEEATEKGLEWLKRAQAQDGHWEGQGGAYPVAMSALAGMAFLMEGSNLKEGKYSDQIQKAVDWFLKHAQQANGLLGFNKGNDFGSYMHGHGFATMFLACAYGEAEDKEQQQKLEKAVKKAADFCTKAQINRKHPMPEGKTVDIGGWGYTSAAENGGGDEGSITVTQLQALRAARNAGIAYPRKRSTRQSRSSKLHTPAGGMIYSYGGGGRAAERCRTPTHRARRSPARSAPVNSLSDLARKWIKFCKEKIPIAKGRVAHDEYQNYYFGQMMYILGETRTTATCSPRKTNRRG
ncbi:MAG: hypothetical protein U0792_15600 [Gemmataceae bacterium]